MKQTVLLCVVLGLSALCTSGQTTNAAPVIAESNVSKKATEQKVPALTQLPPTNKIMGRPVVYGGYFTDLFRSGNWRALLDLRTPIDPIKDLDNLSLYPGTDKVQGVILFAIKF